MTKLKPGASKKTHLFLAAFLWSAVGIGLFVRGLIWLMSGQYLFLFLFFALAAGTIKSLFILDRIAKKNMDRIDAFRDNTCVGSVYSIKTWMLVIGMSGTGYLFRSLGLPQMVVGLIYAAIGWAMFFSSRLIWLQWNSKQHREV